MIPIQVSFMLPKDANMDEAVHCFVAKEATCIGINIPMKP